MTLDALLAFLTARGRVAERDGKLLAGVGEMCEHGE